MLYGSKHSSPPPYSLESIDDYACETAIHTHTCGDGHLLQLYDDDQYQSSAGDVGG